MYAATVPAGRHAALALTFALSGCGLLLDLDPPPPDAAAGDAGARDGGDARPDAGARDAGSLDAGPRDAGSLDAGARDAGPGLATCLEDTTWREERFVAEGRIDVASRGDRIAVSYQQAADRALVQMLDGSLLPVAQFPWDATTDPARLATTSRGFALLQVHMDQVAVVEPMGGMRAMTSGIASAGALARDDPPFPLVAAIVFGPTFSSPGFLEMDYETAFVGVRAVTALGDGTRAIDARLEHSVVHGAYVVVYAEPDAVHLAAFDDTSLELIRPRLTFPATGGATVPPAPDLSLAVSGSVAAVAMRVDRAGVLSSALAFADDTGAIRVVSDPSEGRAAMAVASRPGSPVLGVAYVVDGALRFELLRWADAAVLASLVVSAPTEGDVLDVEAEPESGSYLVARKRRDRGGPATVTRIRCRLDA